jgi:peptide/nickel transport system substrate-binding protein
LIDLIKSLNIYRGPNTPSSAKIILAPIKELRAEGDNTIIVELNAPNANFPPSWRTIT